MSYWWKEQVTPSRVWNDVAIISVLGPAECWFLLSQNNSPAYLANPSPSTPYLTYEHAYVYENRYSYIRTLVGNDVVSEYRFEDRKWLMAYSSNAYSSEAGTWNFILHSSVCVALTAAEGNIRSPLMYAVAGAIRPEPRHHHMNMCRGNNEPAEWCKIVVHAVTPAVLVIKTATQQINLCGSVWQ
ncbi:hypothetical protein CBL_07531 [Carabus blaptoides fortunei]